MVRVHLHSGSHSNTLSLLKSSHRDSRSRGGMAHDRRIVFRRYETSTSQTGTLPRGRVRLPISALVPVDGWGVLGVGLITLRDCTAARVSKSPAATMGDAAVKQTHRNACPARALSTESSTARALTSCEYALAFCYCNANSTPLLLPYYTINTLKMIILQRYGR